MKEKVIVILILGLCVCGLAGAAIYDWTGAVDGDWGNSGNWSVTGSTWVHPNEEFGNEYTNQDCDEIRIVNGDVVTRSIDLSIDGARDGSNTGNLILDNGSTLILGDDGWISDWGGSKGQVDVLGGSLLDVSDDFRVGDDNGSVGTLNIIGSTFRAGDQVRIGHRAGAVGYLNIVDSDVSFGGHLMIAQADGSTGYLYIGGNSTVSIGNQLYMNDDGGNGLYSELVMDGGTVTTVNNTYFNDDAGAGSQAYVTMNGGTWNSGGMIAISWNADALSHLTMNGGEMIAGTAVNLGVSTGGTGESRIFFNDGLVQGEDLNFNMTDSKIVFSDGWGKLKINSSSVSETDMQAFIDSGNIDVSALIDYTISTDSGYTVLAPVPGVAGIVAPLAGASGVPVDTILEWLSPEAYEGSGFRVYFGEDPNEQSPGWFGNNEIVSGDNVNEIDPAPAGDLKYFTTYYWRVDALEPNSPAGDIVHSGRIWTFTTEKATPVILTHPVTQFVDDGADVDFTVVATTPGGKANTFEWFDPNDQQIVSDGSKYTIVSDDATSTLTIHGAAGDDEGLYYSRVTNDGAIYVSSRTASLALNKLIGYWPLDEGTGTLAEDVVGGVNGTLEAGVNWVEGMVGDYAMETGLGTAAIVADAPDSYQTPYVSMSCWAIITDAPADSWDGIVGHVYDTGSTEAGWLLYEYAGGIEWYASQGGTMEDIRADNVPRGVWNHYVGIVSDSEIKLYINGELIGSKPFSGGVSYTEKPSAHQMVLGIGVTRDNDENLIFDGSVDDVRIYNYALDAYAVAELYNSGSGKFVCLDPPVYDLTDDCVVDLADVAAIAGLWAECGIHPPSYCP